MKKRLRIGLIIVALLVSIATMILIILNAYLCTSGGNRIQVFSTNREHTQSNSVFIHRQESITNFPSKEVRLRLPREERIRLLESLGHVPDDGDRSDYKLAENTTWWGKTLDPKEFWKDRVVWLDQEAAKAATQHGRLYPPIPYEDPNLPHYNDINEIHPSSDGYSGNYRFNSKEGAFWAKFARTHPRPPEQIEREQLNVAEELLRAKMRDGYLRGDYTRDSKVLGFPSEALEEETLLWIYVLKKRQEYQDLMSRDDPRGQEIRMRHYIMNLYVDPKYILEPINNDDMQKADAWKLKYLHRLKHENIDESYINAYLKAWNLSRENVFQEQK